MLYDARSKTINFALVRTCTNKFAATACYATTRCLPYAVYRPHLYAASVWRGFTKASDRQRIDAVLRRSKRCGYYAVHLPVFEELCENIDDQLFNKTVDKGAGSGMAGMAAAIPIQNLVLRRHTNQK